MPLTAADAKLVADQVWRTMLQALDANGKEIPDTFYSAKGMLANVNGRVQGLKIPTPVEIWEQPVPARTADNKVDPDGKTYPAQTMLANVNAKSDYEYANPQSAPSIDYNALAAALKEAGVGQDFTIEQLTQAVKAALLSINFDITTSEG